ncbi:hypothetical protein M083_2708 [Bacteroides fragilis str. 3986 T(B)9]|nr:hypothetical protein M111_2448 [Bacteroides fragilis str. 3986T(B)10]EXY65057.1 hypothetical protein M085_2503 [Bacteroides fragilis str. 3986 N(B)19]EXY69643.1 hypothetical protein M083_2708 [Bacteroides fragilis str. 3986 T(B)9]EXZ13455.1 hypothetical protein M071_2659 [Bacteroides fragilis str. Ds-233]EYA47749.1 hypothetical protein M115_2461 [Bacteroides fragilis str. 3719 T6]EYA52281.1 hypothetical protein M114_2642 [Bacteroides fragilis str. 3986 N(B)22]EYA56531.1 hypothetical protei
MIDPVTILYFKQEECFSEWTILSYKHTGILLSWLRRQHLKD